MDQHQPVSQEQFLAGGSKSRSARWGAPPDGSPIPGYVEEGPIVEEPEVRQQTKYNPGQKDHGDLLFFENGGPRWQLVIKIQTKHRDDEDDDGVRTIFMKLDMQKKGAEELKRVGKKVFEQGGYIKVMFIEKIKIDGKWNNTWAVRYEPPTVTAQDAFMNSSPAAADPWDQATPIQAGPPATADQQRNSMLDRMKQQQATGVAGLRRSGNAGFEDEPPF